LLLFWFTAKSVGFIAPASCSLDRQEHHEKIPGKIRRLPRKIPKNTWKNRKKPYKNTNSKHEFTTFLKKLKSRKVPKIRRFRVLRKDFFAKKQKNLFFCDFRVTNDTYNKYKSWICIREQSRRKGI
jgi:hypothetical protein